MEVDIFREMIVPIIGGLGIFLLGLDFMSNGIQSLAVNKMRALLAKFAGTPVKGVIAGTMITGVLQSSTAMTVMTVGLVNAGVIALRPAISVIMGANVGTTLGNGLIALPLGPLGLLFAGIAALFYVFGKSERMRNIALACMGFGLIFYGLNLMTGGLKPLRNMPEIMGVISSLTADSFVGLLSCVLIAACITALIHSSSATIGIVMGLGAAGVLDWQTAVAFSLGADLGTTITSWMASLNLSKNAKRAAYAHISFNFIGVAVMLPLFFPAMMLLEYVMGFFGGDPAVPVMVDGEATYPLVPVAVGLYSTAFNIFNLCLLFPFVGVFENVLQRIGRTLSEDIEDFSTPRYLSGELSKDLLRAVPAVEAETRRHLEAGALFLAIARGAKHAPSDLNEHHTAVDILNRDIRKFSADLFRDDMPVEQLDLVGSLIEEADFTASLAESLHQVARRVKREEFGSQAMVMVEAGLTRLDAALGRILPLPAGMPVPMMPAGHVQTDPIEVLRNRVLTTGTGISSAERGAILAIFGSIERAELLIDRIEAERRSVNRAEVLEKVRPMFAAPARSDDSTGSFSPVPAE
ncbi:Na/Pi cotransporter family protein [Fertoebacter nigrum]|uniref:Na/Pi cotransporter family protein n=1 Tax=Fertoeibacter niger TaxID=2656921 RepID=A0A8X8H4W9_9RHOB|nr:Na/Pi symporter [Fertoeibacter niger]NUB45683.1 Na/Pi cotransporter family protein [Fertoeibacter niger]